MSSKKNDDVENKVVEAVQGIEEESNLIELSTGVVLMGKAAPPLALVKVMAAFKRPEVPTFRDDNIGRDIPNPDDPDYLKAVQAYEAESSSAMMNTMIIFGTEIHKTPRNFQKPSDNVWIEEYEAVGLTAWRKNDTWRYLNWVLFKAAPKAEDVQAIQEVVGRLSGVPENAVQDAEEFPGSDTK